MNDLMDRLAAANPVAEDRTPSIEDVWSKIDGAQPGRGAWRAGRWALAIAAVALPVIAVALVAVVLRGAEHRGSRPAINRVTSGGSTVDPALQAAALRQLSGRDGEIVVLDPRTGSVEALAASATDSSALWAPEATFDVVTAAAALDSGRYDAGSRISGDSPEVLSGTTVRNNEGASFGSITLGQALASSAKTVFARVGVKLGAETITTYMRRFGFYAAPGVDGIPASGIRVGGTLVLPSAGRVPLGALAAGQGDLRATALQMAMLAATVADGGILATPHLDTARASGSGRRVISARTASVLTEMMRGAVSRGTGTQAGLDGLGIAGKTGTAAAGAGGHGTVVSFIGFAPAAHPTVAIAVVLRDPSGGFGGTVAAPIAARVIRSALGYGR
jgi:peptidoglycan glycosyltransferase